ncbi:glycoside hydrolase superfamily [Aspergillus venezuelensis]
MLRTSGSRVINPAGETIILKGVAIGGMLNMEDFITGYAGHEHEHREQMASVLGEEKAQFFFDTLLHHFFTDSDAALFACVEICGRHNIYAILDLHSAPGGQNQDWHCDSGIARASFWDFKDHQGRAIRLWEVIASRYAGNFVVAGYNPLNEPADPTLDDKGRPGARLLAWYARVEKAIRAVDAEHMLFLDGNTYSMDFTAFEDTPPLPNTVSSIHDYSKFGFPGMEHFERKVAFMRRANVPVWNGEFGPVYQDPKRDGAEAAATVNAGCLALLAQQLSMYRDPDSAYLRLIQPFLEKKQRLGLNFWSIVPRNAMKPVYDTFFAELKGMVDKRFHKGRYPKQWTLERQFERVIRETLLSEYVGWEMAELFRGKNEEEFEELAASFALENCVVRGELNEVLKRDALAGDV